MTYSPPLNDRRVNLASYKRKTRDEWRVFVNWGKDYTHTLTAFTRSSAREAVEYFTKRGADAFIKLEGHVRIETCDEDAR